MTVVIDIVMTSEKLTRINLTIPDHLVKYFKAISKKERRSLSSQLAYWIEEKLEEMEDEIDLQFIEEFERGPKTLISSDEFWAEAKKTDVPD